MDYQSGLYDAIYLTIGVPCVIITADGEVLPTMTALDKTAGVVLGDNTGQLQMVVPAACIRITELRANDINGPEDLPDAKVTLNGKDWTVESYRLRPSPKGEDDGEALLILTKWIAP
jgi:hypothetical protein